MLSAAAASGAAAASSSAGAVACSSTAPALFRERAASAGTPLFAEGILPWKAQKPAAATTAQQAAMAAYRRQRGKATTFFSGFRSGALSRRTWSITRAVKPAGAWSSRPDRAS